MSSRLRNGLNISLKFSHMFFSSLLRTHIPSQYVCKIPTTDLQPIKTQLFLRWLPRPILWLGEVEFLLFEVVRGNLLINQDASILRILFFVARMWRYLWITWLPVFLVHASQNICQMLQLPNVTSAIAWRNVTFVCVEFLFVYIELQFILLFNMAMFSFFILWKCVECCI